MIKGILFDVHGTIIESRGKEVINRGLEFSVAFLNNNGYRMTLDEYQQAWLHNLKKHRKDLEELNEVNFYDFFDGILSDAGLKDYDETLMYQLNDHFMKGLRDDTREMPHAKQVLAELHKDFLLGVVSNSMERNTHLDLTITGLIDFFDGTFISSEIGKRKPHPIIFTKALEGLSLRSEETIFVGDDLFEDIMGANQMGMKTIFMAQGNTSKEFAKKEIFEKILQDKGLLKEDIQPEKIEKADYIISDLRELLELVKQWK